MAKSQKKKIKQSNELTQFSLKGLSAKEIDLFSFLCFKVQEKGIEELSIPLSEIKKEVSLRHDTKEDLANELTSMSEKLASLNFFMKKNDKYIQFTFFCTFRVDKELDVLKVSVDENFAYLVNNTIGNFSIIDLKTLFSLKSVYSKQVYKRLMQYRNTRDPFWQINQEDFREYLGLPESYQQGVLKERVIDRALKELSPYFEGLNCEIITDNKSRKVGRLKVTGYKFTWMNEVSIKDEDIPF